MLNCWHTFTIELFFCPYRRRGCYNKSSDRNVVQRSEVKRSSKFSSSRVPFQNVLFLPKILKNNWLDKTYLFVMFLNVRTIHQFLIKFSPAFNFVPFWKSDDPLDQHWENSFLRPIVPCTYLLVTYLKHICMLTQLIFRVVIRGLLSFRLILSIERPLLIMLILFYLINQVWNHVLF